MAHEKCKSKTKLREFKMQINSNFIFIKNDKEDKKETKKVKKKAKNAKS